MPSRSETCFSDFHTAAQAVECVLLAALPPNIPPSFQRIVSAKFHGANRTRRAVAHLIMFDGRHATAEVFIAGKMGRITVWGHRWTEMPGGACSWEGDRWVRCDDEGNIVPDQMTLPLAAE